jgi:tetratricopeptide (TPR) repeat protein
VSEAWALSLPDIDALWDYVQPGETEAKFRELMDRARSGPDRNYEAELLTQLARSLGLQQKFDAAHAILDEVEPLLDSLTPRVRVRYLLERGRTFNSSGFRERADTLFVQAWEEGLDQGLEGLAVDAAHMVAIARPEASLEWNLLALETAEASLDPAARKWRGSLYNNLGWTFFGRKEYASAQRSFEQALACRVEQGNSRDILLARWCLAKCLRFTGQVEASLAEQQELERAWQNEGEADGFVYEELAECLLLLTRVPESRLYFGKAYELLSKDPWLTRDEPDRLQRLLENSRS